VKGPASAGPPGTGHAALIYLDPPEFAAAVRGFVRAGSEAGAAVLVAARADNLSALRADLDGAAGQVTMADLASSGVNPGRALGMIRQFAVEHGGEQVRCVQELAWRSRPEAELSEALRQEALIELAVRTAPLNVLCTYDARLGATVLETARRTHRAVFEHGHWQASPSYDSASTARWPSGPPLAAPPAGAATMSYWRDQAAARAFAADCARAAGLPDDRVTDLVIAVGELTANTLAHAAGPGTLTVWTTKDEIICQVQDGGQIADPLAGTLRADPSSPRHGRGLWVVNQICDLVEVRTGSDGTTVRLHVRQ
jgi:anti-sigma regulatory factor (Ser/Thr protein kinase)